MSRFSRRAFIGQLGAAAFLPLQQAQGPLAGQGEVGTLRDPMAAGRPRAPTEIADYDERIKSIEQRLACTCGCTLDIFTCRTTARPRAERAGRGSTQSLIRGQKKTRQSRVE